MNIQQLQAWVESLRKIGENNIPYLEVDGKMLTPEDLLREAMANSSVWQKAKKLLGNPVPNPKLSVSYDLLKKRYEQKVKEGKIYPIATIGGKKLTPEQQLKEIEEGTLIGQQLLLAEASLIEEIEKRRKKIRR